MSIDWANQFFDLFNIFSDISVDSYVPFAPIALVVAAVLTFAVALAVKRLFF